MAEEDPERAFAELSVSISCPLSSDELLEIGHLGVTLVVARTKHGVDADGKKFAKYKPGYARERTTAGLQVDPPDLARSGHMLGAMGPEVTADNEVTVSFASELEAKKAATNNDGSKKLVDIREHKRRKDAKAKRRTRKVTSHQRQMNTDAREFLDIRQPREMDVMGEAISEILARRVER